MLDIEFIQVLQDMIGDLTGAPEPVVVKLFSPDPELLSTWAPQVAEALEKVTIGGKTPVVDVEDGIENTTSGPAVRVHGQSAKRGSGPGSPPRNSARSPSRWSKASRRRRRSSSTSARTRCVCAFRLGARSSLEAMSNTMLVSSIGGTATLGSLATVDELPGQTEVRRENLQREVEVTARLEGVDMGTGIAAVQKAVADLKLPPSIRVEYGGTYQEQQKSFRDLALVLVLAVVLVFLVLLFEFRSFTAPVAILSSAILSTSGVFLALLVTRTTFNVSSFMGLIMVIGIVAKNGILLLDANEKFRADRILGRGRDHSGGPPAAAADRDDRAGGRRGHAAAGTGPGRGIADASAAGDRRDRRNADLDGAVARHHARDPVLPGEAVARRGMTGGGAAKQSIRSGIVGPCVYCWSRTNLPRRTQYLPRDCAQTRLCGGRRERWRIGPPGSGGYRLRHRRARPDAAAEGRLERASGDPAGWTQRADTHPTARDAVDARVEGFDAGADDYLVKPFNLPAPTARVRALVRGGRQPLLPESLAVGDLVLDTRARRVRLRGRDVPLTAKEYAFLGFLPGTRARSSAGPRLPTTSGTRTTTRSRTSSDVNVQRLGRKLDRPGADSIIRTPSR